MNSRQVFLGRRTNAAAGRTDALVFLLFQLAHSGYKQYTGGFIAQHRRTYARCSPCSRFARARRAHTRP